MHKGLERYCDTYRELAELIGEGEMIRLWEKYRGLNVYFPQDLFSREYKKTQIEQSIGEKRAADLARELHLSERRVRQINSEIRADQKKDFSEVGETTE
ncbi:MAG: hypothetical protein IKS07_10860 [Lachnospiraceae bacterium]|nr:hypothetical protein [Lachnospiraceae bacterium]